MPEMQVSFLNMSAEGEGSPKKFKKYRAFIGIGVIAAAVGLSSTLAANININAGPVEFGQGVAQTVACSGEESIIVTPATSFTNAPASVTRDATFYGGDTITVTSTENLSVGMLLDVESMFPYVIIEINGLEIRLSYPVNIETTFPVTFTPSAGIEQKNSNTGEVTNTSEYIIGESSLYVGTSGVEIGMLVSGPGIPANTVVVYWEPTEGQYLALSKETTYSSGELTFTNSGKSAFELSDITVSGIPDSCTNKVFTIKIYDNESSEPLAISDWSDTSVQVWWANGYQGPDYGSTQVNEAVIQFPAQNRAFTDWDNEAFNSNYAIETARYTDVPARAFKINLPKTVDASRVYKITVESQDDSDAFNVGDVANNPDFSFYDWRDWY
jgi:hypothetical protein